VVNCLLWWVRSRVYMLEMVSGRRERRCGQAAKELDERNRETSFIVLTTLYIQKQLYAFGCLNKQGEKCGVFVGRPAC
jgi:hypothetical protein